MVTPKPPTPSAFLDDPAADQMSFIPPADTGEALRALDHAHQQLAAAEVAELVAIAHLADLHQVDSLAVGEGLERLVRPGHHGTPLVGEFLALEISALLGISPASGLERVGDALDLRHRHPRLWAQVLAGRVRVWQAIQVCRQAAHLNLEAATRLDQTVAHALAMMPWGRVMTALPGWITAADPQAAERRAADIAEDRRVCVSQIRDGHVEFYGRVNPADGIRFDHALNQIAATLPADPTRHNDHQHRRAAAVGVLARQVFGQDVLPTHTLVVHINATDPTINPNTQPGGLTRAQSHDNCHGTTGASHTVTTAAVCGSCRGGVARVEGWGPLLTTWLPEFLANSKVIVRPVVDPATLGAADCYETSATIRFALEQRNPVDVFPWATRPARTCDADHTSPYTPGIPGQTGLANLGPLSRFTHRAKTHTRWCLTQPQPGVFHWTSPHGYQYQVTAAGTTRIHTPPNRLDSSALP